MQLPEYFEALKDAKYGDYIDRLSLHAKVSRHLYEAETGEERDLYVEFMRSISRLSELGDSYALLCEASNSWNSQYTARCPLAFN